MPNLISQVRNAVVNFFSGSRQQGQTLTRLLATSTTEIYPNPGSETAINKGFKGNAAIYSIVKKAAKKFGSIPRYVEKKGQEGKDYSEVNEQPGPLTELLNRPNPLEGQDVFLTKVYGYYKTIGEAIIWCNRGDTDAITDTGEFIKLEDGAHAKKPILEMYNISPNQIAIVPDPQDAYGILYWQLMDRPDIKFRKVDIIHWKDLNLDWDLTTRSHMRGFSALFPGNKTLEANNSATDATVRMNQNGGAKGVLSNELGGQNPMQQSQVEKVINEKINNIDVKGAVAALQGKWNYHDIGLTSVDMETLKGKELSMQELCFLFGMPYEFFDSQTTFSNKEMAQKAWVINEIMPDCKQLDGEMNRVLLKAFGVENTATICSDFDEMPELQEDKGKQVEWLSKMPITPNEYREALGYETVTEDGSDEIIIPSGYVHLDDIAGDGGEELMQSLYNANGSANRGNGNGKVPANGQGKKLQAGAGKT